MFEDPKFIILLVNLADPWPVRTLQMSWLIVELDRLSVCHAISPIVIFFKGEGLKSWTRTLTSPQPSPIYVDR